jgi:hypothetical protein
VSRPVGKCASERNRDPERTLIVGSKKFLGWIQFFYLSQRTLSDSLLVVNHSSILRKRDRLAASLPDASDVLRGSLLQRIIRHRSGCPKCERGEGHPVAVLATGYPGGRIRQICLRKDQVAYVKRCLANYQKLKAAIERVCELNQELLRIEPEGKDSPRVK